MRVEFKDRIKALRKEKGLSQTQLAVELGVSRVSVSFYENADRTAGIDFIYKAAKFFNCTTDYLLGLTDIRQYQPDEKDCRISELEGRIEELEDALRAIHQTVYDTCV